MTPGAWPSLLGSPKAPRFVLRKEICDSAAELLDARDRAFLGRHGLGEAAELAVPVPRHRDATQLLLAQPRVQEAHLLVDLALDLASLLL